MSQNVRVAINGFGRIGRLAFRQMFGAEGYEIVAINDLTSPRMLAHLLKYDSTQGNYANSHKVESAEAVLNEDGTVKEDGYIVVDGKKITIYAQKNAADLPWKALDVDVVLECTGFYTSKAKAQAHITAGAKKVVISAPAGNDLPTIVYNVNHKRSIKTTISSPPQAAPPTASLRWQKPLTTLLPSNRALWLPFTLTPATRWFLTDRIARATSAALAQLP